MKKTLVCSIILAALMFSFAPVVYGREPGFTPNYDAVFSGDILGEGPVEWSRGRFISSGAYAEGFVLEFFEASHSGWLMLRVDKKAGIAGFEYRWTNEEGQNFDLSGRGSFTSSKKDRTFTFTSYGDYRLVEWFNDPPGPSQDLWTGKLFFTMSGTEL